MITLIVSRESLVNRPVKADFSLLDDSAEDVPVVKIIEDLCYANILKTAPAYPTLISLEQYR